jgi:hypothetical protein
MRHLRGYVLKVLRLLSISVWLLAVAVVVLGELAGVLEAFVQVQV